MKTSTVLRKAGDVLRERGWCQYGSEDPEGRVCAWRSVRLAGEGYPGSCGRALLVADSAVGDPDIGGLIRWNDRKGRTAAEVMSALDAAYVVALQEEGVEPGDVL